MSAPLRFPTTGRCTTCRALVLWVHTVNDKHMPLDVNPRPDGNLVIEQQPGQPARAVQYQPLIHSNQRRYVSHFASCPHHEQWRRR